MQFVRLVSILAAVVLVFSVAVVPTPARADVGGSASGQFQVGNAAVAVTAVALWTTTGSPIETEDMNPQDEYNVKVDVLDGNTLDDVETVTVIIFYDDDGDYSPDDEDGDTDTQTLAILTWTNGVGFSIEPSEDTSWSLVGANCVTPTLSSGSGTFEFHFIPGKVSTETTGSAKWHIYAKADDGTVTASNTDLGKDMNWFGEIDVNTGSISWGELEPGIDFGSSSKQTVSVTYISNGAYDEQIAASGTWTTGDTVVATLDSSGTCDDPNEFSLKADDTDTLGSAVLVKASPTYGTIDNTGTQTIELGDTVATNTLWLKLSSNFVSASYSGTIYYKIVHGS